MSNKRKFHLHDGKNGSAISIRVTPRMAKNEVHSILDDGTIKIRLTAPPIEGKANKELVRFLSEILEIPASSVEIIAGMTGHDKLVSIIGLDSEKVQQKILAQLNKK
jgi:uncharacterized protein (TIGR00251 family)